MQTVKIEMEPEAAKEALAAYRADKGPTPTAYDREVTAAYMALSKGKLVIRAIESVRRGGVDERGRPKLALCRADAKACLWHVDWNGRAGEMMRDIGGGRWPPYSDTSRFKFTDWPEIPKPVNYERQHRAILPPIPRRHRPEKNLQDYFLLWEAEWSPVPPVDPYLLKRIGRADLWIVLAMWDLSEVERAVLAPRLMQA